MYLCTASPMLASIGQAPSSCKQHSSKPLQPRYPLAALKISLCESERPSLDGKRLGECCLAGRRRTGSKHAPQKHGSPGISAHTSTKLHLPSDVPGSSAPYVNQQ